MARSKKNIFNNAEISNQNTEKDTNNMNKKDKEEEIKVIKSDKESFDVMQIDNVKEMEILKKETDLVKKEEKKEKPINKSKKSSFATTPTRDNPLSKTQKLGVNYNFNMSTTPMI